MIFSSKRVDRRLIDQLDDLERRAETAHGPGGAATYLNQAGDLCLNAARLGDALVYYGKAIDVHVQADRFDAAGAVCRKVIRTAPAVIRARCTLAWLALGSGHEADARDHTQLYLRMAELAGREMVALLQVRRMATVAESDDLRLFLGEVLLDLGDESAADHLFGRVFRERNALDQPMAVDPDERWSVARRAALQGPKLGW
jgi:hypothetical protein